MRESTATARVGRFRRRGPRRRDRGTDSAGQQCRPVRDLHIGEPTVQYVQILGRNDVETVLVAGDVALSHQLTHRRVVGGWGNSTGRPGQTQPDGAGKVFTDTTKGRYCSGATPG